MKSRTRPMWVKKQFAVSQRCVIRSAALAFGLAECMLALAPTANAQETKFITFDAPGAVDTFALAINTAGAATGNYGDANAVFHGYFRASDGTITTFDAPGAGTGFFQGTFPAAINPAGVISGSYSDGNSLSHGFVRAPNGTLTTFDAPGATAGPIGTVASTISPEGVVTGFFFDANSVAHAFMRTSDGDVTTFDDPSAGTGLFQGTVAAALDPQGAVVGCYTQLNGASFGFLRRKKGAFITVNPPGGLGSFGLCGTFGSSLPSMTISLQGTIAGAYFLPVQGNPFGGNFRGFVRSHTGSYSTFDAVPSPSSPCCTWTFPLSITPAGQIVGFDNDFRSANHAFLRDVNGAITLFDVPGAGGCCLLGTVAASINPGGVIAGYYVDTNFVAHGFLRIP